MNNSLNEYLRFNFELNIELNHFLARFNVKINNQNVSATPSWQWTMLPLSPIFTYSTILSAISQSLLPSVDVNIPTCRLTPIYQFPVHCVFPLASPLSKSGSWTDTICPSLRP